MFCGFLYDDVYRIFKVMEKFLTAARKKCNEFKSDEIYLTWQKLFKTGEVNPNKIKEEAVERIKDAFILMNHLEINITVEKVLKINGLLLSDYDSNEREEINERIKHILLLEPMIDTHISKVSKECKILIDKNKTEHDSLGIPPNKRIRIDNNTFDFVI